MNDLNNFDKTDREYSLALTDDLIRFLRSKVKRSRSQLGSCICDLVCHGQSSELVMRPCCYRPSLSRHMHIPVSSQCPDHLNQPISFQLVTCRFLLGDNVRWRTTSVEAVLLYVRPSGTCQPGTYARSCLSSLPSRDRDRSVLLIARLFQPVPSHASHSAPYYRQL